MKFHKMLIRIINVQFGKKVCIESTQYFKNNKNHGTQNNFLSVKTKFILYQKK